MKNRRLPGKKKLNLVGRQVSRFRNERGWSQEELAGRLYDAGWRAARRSTVSKIEGGTVYVHDFQVAWLAAVLGAPMDALYPQFDSGQRIQDSIFQHVHNAKRGLAPQSDSIDPGLLAELRQHC
ncbi:MAG TPA: helix-turn-helix domain-containing protein [Candidatus Saccharimonadales bacterium]|nr:helix-turn-helix domain-containing protein [Candidatus Saccharimonadales bacterium]